MTASSPLPSRHPDSPRRAIVLSGGGARGAYEAGVLRFILDELPKRTGIDPDFELPTIRLLPPEALGRTREAAPLPGPAELDGEDGVGRCGQQPYIRFG